MKSIPSIVLFAVLFTGSVCFSGQATPVNEVSKNISATKFTGTKTIPKQQGNHVQRNTIKIKLPLVSVKGGASGSKNLLSGFAKLRCVSDPQNICSSDSDAITYVRMSYEHETGIPLRLKIQTPGQQTASAGYRMFKLSEAAPGPNTFTLTNMEYGRPIESDSGNGGGFLNGLASPSQFELVPSDQPNTYFFRDLARGKYITIDADRYLTSSAGTPESAALFSIEKEEDWLPGIKVSMYFRGPAVSNPRIDIFDADTDLLLESFESDELQPSGASSFTTGRLTFPFDSQLDIRAAADSHYFKRTALEGLTMNRERSVAFHAVPLPSCDRIKEHMQVTLSRASSGTNFDFSTTQRCRSGCSIGPYCIQISNMENGFSNDQCNEMARFVTNGCREDDLTECCKAKAVSSRTTGYFRIYDMEGVSLGNAGEPVASGPIEDGAVFNLQ